MKIKYRPEIDGLRALSVISVIIYHFGKISENNFFQLKGGFLGVDVFFVISGYLITLIILKEIDATKNFSFLNFYLRRVRRILPALLVMMLMTFPLAWYFLLPYDLVDFSKSVLSILTFNSNFFFWYNQTQYAAEAAIYKPLLHTWSLAVEEQYYIFMPIFLLISFKFLKKYLLLILISFFILSLIISTYGSSNFPNFNFYNLISRSFEILSGSILAFIKLKFTNKINDENLKSIFSIVGIILILFSFFYFDEGDLLPSIYSLVPIFGACLVIYFSEDRNIINKILSNKYLVYIGLISYSLYLWHYPIFSFAKITDVNTNNLINTLLINFIFILLAIFSYHFVEKPFRDRQKFSFKKLINYNLSLSSLIVTISIIVLFYGGFKNRVPELFHENINYVRDRDIPKCLNKYEGVSGCDLNSKASKTIFLLGDSHMSDLYNFGLKDILLDKNYRLITYGCPTYQNFDFKNAHTKKIVHKCSSKNFSIIKEKLNKFPNSTVIIFQRMPLHLTGRQFNNYEGGIEGQLSNVYFEPIIKELNLEESFTNFINDLSKININTILIYPYPEAGWQVPKKILSSIPKDPSKLNNFLVPKNFITTSYEVYKTRTKTSFELLDSQKGENIYRIYPHEFLCDNLIKNRCITHDEKKIYYRDDDHPSRSAAKIINNEIIKKLSLIEN